MDSVRIQTAPLPLGEPDFGAGDDAARCGAVVQFRGKVRGNADGPPLSHLELEHFPGVTEAEIERIVAMARQRWALRHVLVIHRVGRIPLGEDIVLVATASAHRLDAYEANAYIMDYLKTQAPFWKQECLADGSAHWVAARRSDDRQRARWEAGAGADTAAVGDLAATGPTIAAETGGRRDAGRRIGALILAGGRGSRMQHRNKGLLPLDGQPLVRHLVDRLRPQVGYLAISANRDLDAYRALGLPVFPDEPDWRDCGPLGGIQSAAPHFPPDLDAILVTPCDTPFLPADLVGRLAQALFAPGGPAAAVAATAQGLEPGIFLCRPALLLGLPRHLREQSSLSLRAWLQAGGYAPVHFDDPGAFANLNDPQALEAAQPRP